MRNVVFCDNEGCLTPGKGKPFELGKMKELAVMLAENPSFVFLLCTGRSMPYCEALLQCIGLSQLSAPVICEGGATLFWPDTERFELLGGGVPRDEILDSLPTGAYREELGKLATLSLYPESGYTVEQLRETVLLLAENHDLPVEIRASAAAVDITPPGVDKGTAIERVCEIMGADAAQATGIGDSDNDIPMLEQVGHPSSPANGTAAVREICDYVSEHDATAGVIDILQKTLNEFAPG